MSWGARSRLHESIRDSVHVVLVSPPRSDSPDGEGLREALRMRCHEPHFFFHRVYLQEALEHYYPARLRPTSDVRPMVVFVDLSTPYEPLARTVEAIFEIRKRYPHIVFVLYLDPDEYAVKKVGLPGPWADRLEHYYRLTRQGPDPDLLALDEILAMARAQAIEQFRYVRSTARQAYQIFISYSRRDLDFASAFVDCLEGKGYAVWFDQQSIVGGDLWRESIQAGLADSVLALLVVSPDALQSEYVRYEYEAFIANDKPLLPVICRPVDALPEVVQRYQYLDVTQADLLAACGQVLQAVTAQIDRL